MLTTSSSPSRRRRAAVPAAPPETAPSTIHVPAPIHAPIEAVGMTVKAAAAGKRKKAKKTGAAASGDRADDAAARARAALKRYPDRDAGNPESSRVLDAVFMAVAASAPKQEPARIIRDDKTIIGFDSLEIASYAATCLRNEFFEDDVSPDIRPILMRKSVDAFDYALLWVNPGSEFGYKKICASTASLRKALWLLDSYMDGDFQYALDGIEGNEPGNFPIMRMADDAPDADGKA